MENERSRSVKVFRAAVRRNFRLPQYWTKILSVVILAALSPFILEAVLKSAALLPPQIMEAFKSGNSYNIGILTVPSLDSDIMTRCDEIVCGVLSGSVIECFAVFAATGFVAKEFSASYIKIAIMHGEKRPLIFAKYMGISALITLPAVVLPPVCVMAAMNAGYGLTLENPADAALTLLVQSVMLIAVSLCFAAIAFTFDGKGGSIIGIASVLALPLIPSYIEIFTSGKVKIGGAILISRLVNSGENIAAHAAADLAVALVTALIFLGLGLTAFLFRNYD